MFRLFGQKGKENIALLKAQFFQHIGKAVAFFIEIVKGVILLFKAAADPSHCDFVSVSGSALLSGADIAYGVLSVLNKSIVHGG